MTDQSKPTTDMPELKNCPCCGSKAVIKEWMDYQELGRRPETRFIIQCKKECVSTLQNFATREQVIETWNTRADLVPEPKTAPDLTCHENMSKKSDNLNMTAPDNEAYDLVRNSAVYTDKITITMSIPEYENILKPALQQQDDRDLVRALETISQHKSSYKDHKFMYTEFKKFAAKAIEEHKAKAVKCQQ